MDQASAMRAGRLAERSDPVSVPVQSRATHGYSGFVAVPARTEDTG